jgi:hypothetical protein
MNLEIENVKKPEEQKQDAGLALAAAVWQGGKLNGQALPDVFKGVQQKLDSNKDGGLSLGELENANKAQMTATEAILAEVMRSHFDFLARKQAVVEPQDGTVVTRKVVSDEDIKNLNFQLNHPVSDRLINAGQGALLGTTVGALAGMYVGYLADKNLTFVLGAAAIGAVTGAGLADLGYVGFSRPNLRSIIKDFSH